jgi:methyltransferase
MTAYVLLLVAISLERLAELVVSNRHAATMRARGGVEQGAGHYPFVVALHVALLAGCFLEPVLADRPFIPALAWPMLLVVVAAQALRWWCIATLGEQWNTRVIVAPALPLVSRGPYRWSARSRWLRHPNYLAVVAEGAALPLVHSAWVTAAAFTVLNAAVLTVRIRVENAALSTARETARA